MFVVPSRVMDVRCRPVPREAARRVESERLKADDQSRLAGPAVSGPQGVGSNKSERQKRRPLLFAPPAPPW